MEGTIEVILWTGVTGLTSFGAITARLVALMTDGAV